MKGDPSWAFDSFFRQKWLPAFMFDLRALEATGFHNENSCPRVGTCLREIAGILDSIPNVRPPAPSIAADFQQLAGRYERWNHHTGDAPGTREERAMAHKNLKRKKDRLVDRIGDSLPNLQNQINWPIVDSLFESLSAMTNDESLNGVFGLLRKNLDSFAGEMNKYRGPNWKPKRQPGT